VLKTQKPRIAPRLLRPAGSRVIVGLQLTIWQEYSKFSPECYPVSGSVSFCLPGRGLLRHRSLRRRALHGSRGVEGNWSRPPKQANLK
jgi:hypothetical protein